MVLSVHELPHKHIQNIFMNKMFLPELLLKEYIKNWLRWNRCLYFANKVEINKIILKVNLDCAFFIWLQSWTRDFVDFHKC